MRFRGRSPIKYTSADPQVTGNLHSITWNEIHLKRRRRIKTSPTRKFFAFNAGSSKNYIIIEIFPISNYAIRNPFRLQFNGLFCRLKITATGMFPEWSLNSLGCVREKNFSPDNLKILRDMSWLSASVRKGVGAGGGGMRIFGFGWLSSKFTHVND